MAIKTLVEQIEELDATITAVQNGQSATTSSGESLTMPDLNKLMENRESLVAKYNSSRRAIPCRNAGLYHR